MIRGKFGLLTVTTVLALVGCNSQSPEMPNPDENVNTTPNHDDHSNQVFVLKDKDAITAKATAADTLVFEPDASFTQVGFLMQADARPNLEVRARRGDTWGSWQKVELTWTEAPYFNGQAVLSEPARALELRGAEDLNNANIEFFEQTVATTGLLARDLPRAQSSELTPQALPGLTTRAQWGARAPKCSRTPHTPERIG